MAVGPGSGVVGTAGVCGGGSGLGGGGAGADAMDVDEEQQVAVGSSVAISLGHPGADVYGRQQRQQQQHGVHVGGLGVDQGGHGVGLQDGGVGEGRERRSGFHWLQQLVRKR